MTRRRSSRVPPERWNERITMWWSSRLDAFAPPESEQSERRFAQLRRNLMTIVTRLAVFVVGLPLVASCSAVGMHARVAAPPNEPVRTFVEVPETTLHWQGEMAGEVTRTSVILQARLTFDGQIRSAEPRGRAGLGAFVLSKSESFENAFRTPLMAAARDGDFILKTAVTDLEPGTRYHYRLLSGPSVESLAAGPTGTFRTLDDQGVSREVRLVVVTGMNRFAFRALAMKNLAWEDLRLGFPALETIVALQPDFFVGTGDNVYYDCPFIRRAHTVESMRDKWHRQFATPRFAELFLRVPTYWEKDDHDFRYDDADPYGDVEPSAELGARVFLEQVPVVGPQDDDSLTYRTHRLNDLVQIWLVEVREHRDSNPNPPGPDKSMWGEDQRKWLKQTLLESDTTFKVVISPTCMVGPDDDRKGGQGGVLAPYFGGRALGQEGDPMKRDNHMNTHGFRHEAEDFFAWLVENSFLESNLYLVCGDKHWQYHSIHPSGFEEFSVGALVDANSRLGPVPGDVMSTDPQGLVSQLYSQDEASGGFLEINLSPLNGSQTTAAEFNFYDERGTLLYAAEKSTRD
jgi:alkaline phosphatase D